MVCSMLNSGPAGVFNSDLRSDIEGREVERYGEFEMEREESFPVVRQVSRAHSRLASAISVVDSVCHHNLVMAPLAEEEDVRKGV